MKSYFTIDELTWSTTATINNINNTPPAFIKENLEKLIEFLNPLREAWGSPIIITSGYRSQQLNDKIGGSSTSAHCYGWAADMIPQNKELDKFKQFVKEYLKDKKFDQYIDEQSGNSSWVHLGLYHPDGKQQRRQFLLYRNGKYNKLD